MILIVLVLVYIFAGLPLTQYFERNPWGTSGAFNFVRCGIFGLLLWLAEVENAYSSEQTVVDRFRKRYETSLIQQHRKPLELGQALMAKNTC